jgi:hypothetical protein
LQAEVLLPHDQLVKRCITGFTASHRPENRSKSSSTETSGWDPFRTPAAQVWKRGKIGGVFFAGPGLSRMMADITKTGLENFFHKNCANGSPNHSDGILRRAPQMLSEFRAMIYDKGATFTM